MQARMRQEDLSGDGGRARHLRMHQEAFDMLHKVKEMDPSKYAWVIPWPGDLHFLMNFGKTILNSNNFHFTLQFLGIAYGWQAGHLRALELPARYGEPMQVRRGGRGDG